MNSVMLRKQNRRVTSGGLRVSMVLSSRRGVRIRVSSVWVVFAEDTHTLRECRLAPPVRWGGEHGKEREPGTSRDMLAPLTYVWTDNRIDAWLVEFFLGGERGTCPFVVHAFCVQAIVLAPRN